jgi:phage repressor protein C with HTH and peptisase S24 domain
MAENPTIRTDRLREEIENSGSTATSVAHNLGISQSAVSQILSGTTRNSRHLPRIADLLGVTVSYLLGTSDSRTAERAEGFYEETAREMDAVLLQEVDIRYGMGAGGFASDHLPGTPVAFPREWIRPLIKGRFDQVFIAHASGDSMSPTLCDGDVVIIDRAQRHLGAQDNVWCVALGELCMIKRIRLLPDGSYQINSDNPAVTPMTAHDGEMHVIGRVIWSGRKI